MGGAALVAEAELLLRRTAEAGNTPASTGGAGRINQSTVFSAHAPLFLFTGSLTRRSRAVRLVCLTGFIHRALPRQVCTRLLFFLARLLYFFSQAQARLSRNL
jgi:hypothetical protein